MQFVWVIELTRLLVPDEMANVSTWQLPTVGVGPGVTVRVLAVATEVTED